MALTAIILKTLISLASLLRSSGNKLFHTNDLPENTVIGSGIFNRSKQFLFNCCKKYGNIRNDYLDWSDINRVRQHTSIQQSILKYCIIRLYEANQFSIAFKAIVSFLKNKYNDLLLYLFQHCWEYSIYIV